VIRGYVQRFNDPPVHSFVSMHGPLAGVGGFPNCNLSVALCRTIQRSLGSLAYTASIQVRPHHHGVARERVHLIGAGPH
jgi:palmitoyl-protein thioesterase